MIVFYYISVALFMLLCILLCCAILVQESKSLGLGASFGGDPGESLFGTSTAEVLKKITAWLAAIFMLACLVLSFWTSSLSKNKVHYQPPSIEKDF